ncbi:adhesion G-protein coupled receptor G2-like [Protopterus annectens]|uniref:adhesion G-protein coupled receptor G2-like n=1 Tax=Protopterus annectens TaxID=7888 RepID=UPI001CFBB907|nr:adhesion G-protein coupled receptor G2-like [Protopterus annectens]
MEIDNNLVIGIQVGNADIQNLSKPVRIIFPLVNTQANVANRSCRFWNKRASEKEEAWSKEGCSGSVNGSQTVCECNHLTFFAVLLTLQEKKLSANVLTSLTLISYIGTGISAIFTAITVIVYFSQRKLQVDDSTKIHINLCSALFLINISFLMNGWLASFHIKSLCILIAVIMHYSLLCCFTWMGIEGFHLYLLLVKVFNIYVRWYMVKLCVVGWGIPAVVVTVVVSLQRYGNISIESEEEQQFTADMCWFTVRDAVYYITVHTYFAIIFTSNVIVFIIVARKVIQMKRLKKGSEALKKACTLLAFSCLFGLTWGLAFFIVGALTTPICFIFTIVNTLQGFFIFLWYCRLHGPLFVTRGSYAVSQDSVTSFAMRKKSSLHTSLDN